VTDVKNLRSLVLFFVWFNTGKWCFHGHFHSINGAIAFCGIIAINDNEERNDLEVCQKGLDLMSTSRVASYWNVWPRLTWPTLYTGTQSQRLKHYRQAYRYKILDRFDGEISSRKFRSKVVQGNSCSRPKDVRSILEFNSPVWSPSLMKNIFLIKSVQRKFTKRIPGMSGLNYYSRLRMLGLESLDLRRLRTDLLWSTEFCLARCVSIAMSFSH